MQVSSWLKQLETHGADALRSIRRWDKVKLREALDWIQANVPADKRWAGLRSVEAAIIDELRERRASPPDRHYLKFRFGHQHAVHLLLRNVLRDPEVYNKHTEPEVGAAIMVCDKYSPQLQAVLCTFGRKVVWSLTSGVPFRTTWKTALARIASPSTTTRPCTKGIL